MARPSACGPAPLNLADYFHASQGAGGEQFVLLPEIIPKEPLGALVRWSHSAQITAEKFGITSQNIDSFMASTNPDVQRLLGRSGDFGKAMGIENDWAVKIIRQVGKVAESWDRDITPPGIPRGINALWTKGGLQYAPPIR